LADVVVDNHHRLLRLTVCATHALTTVLMETDAGLIRLEMFDADAPNTVANSSN
jgi:Peptidyl-prolyl cis-trans isomerase (rotamase) - cyclophilin family